MKFQLALLVAGLLQLSAAHKILVIGDWGQETTSSSRPAQEMVSRAMGKYLEDNPETEYIVSTGDNFYSYGVTSPESERFDSSWRDVYWVPEYPVMSSLPWYISLGNHDHSDDFDELHQVTFGITEPKWILPDLWHDWVDVKDGYSVHWLVVDSQSMRHDKHDVEAQVAWFEEALDSSTADYKIVVAHHTMYGAGRYSGSTTLRRLIQPAMERYDVDVFLSGHDHNLQHVKPEAGLSDKMDYVISGGGGRVLYEFDNDNLEAIQDLGYELVHFEEYYGVVTFDFDPEKMTVDFYSPDSNEDLQLVHTFDRPN